VKQEKIPWLADNPFYTKRFAFFVGRRCRTATVRDVARELHLEWKTVKELEKQYMREQLRKGGHPRPSHHRHRRDCDPQRPYLSNRGQRLAPTARAVVRRTGPIGSEYGPVLCLAGPEEGRKDFAWR
jgi:ribosomal protein L44E